MAKIDKYLAINSGNQITNLSHILIYLNDLETIPYFKYIEKYLCSMKK